MSPPGRLTDAAEDRFWRGVENAGKFFMGEAEPVAFPDPATSAVKGARIALLPLSTLLELKLASGMTAPHRLKDLADVLEVIRVRSLPLELSDTLHPYVREKYVELWQAAQRRDPLSG